MVTATEPLSTKLDIRLETACGVSMVCRIGAAHSTREGRPIREGQQMPMYLDMARVHVFESGEAGRNLVPAGRAACGHGVGSSG